MFHHYRQALVPALAAIAAGGLLGAPVPAATPETVIGYVIDYQGSSSAFAIRRGATSIGVAPAQGLEAGDEVTIVKPIGNAGQANTITLSVAGTSVTVGSLNSPFCVGSQNGKCGAAPEAVTPGIVAMLTGLQNLLSSVVAPSLRVAKADYDSAQSMPLASRGTSSSPALPIVAAPSAYVPADLAMLVIPISGGSQPLQVALYDANGSLPIAQQHDLTDADAHLQLRKLPVGKYRIQVDDAASKAASWTFEAVAATSLPQADPSLEVAMNANQAFVRDLALTAYASFLQSKGPQWYLTAYQELQKASPDFPPARDLLFRLREGP